MSSSRNNFQFMNNPLAIRQEIQRFESVHPSIYAIYDLIELIPDQQIAQQVRDHVVCIEDSFVNSQEWTLSRSVPELRLGIVGSINSGKSALVHRYLTGSYMQEESPEGGRFKKEIFIDNQSYLLLIRDEGGLPEMQFSAWVDAVIFVFSLENEASFNAVYNFYTKMSHFRNSAEIPILLVGTQDSFVNSQEWTLSRSVPELRLGIVGSINSGKSALVHRYLTGSYMQEESPEGGRFKKEIFIDNQSYLLLIRDEGGLPEMQFSAWVDAVIFVFSLENEASFNAVYNFYTKMSHFRNSAEIPILLVGTQDAINEKNPRVIDEARARKLANDLKRCSYYETCATYGLNVETVFRDACQKIAQYRAHTLAPPSCRTPTSSRPTTPQGPRMGIGSAMHSIPQQYSQLSHQEHEQNSVNLLASPSKDFNSSIQSSSLSMNTAGFDSSFQMSNNFSLPPRYHSLSASSHHIPFRSSGEFLANEHQLLTSHGSPGKNWNSIKSHGISQQPNDRMSAPLAALSSLQSLNSSSVPNSKETKELPTPSSTPTTSRKSRRRSNLFIPSSKKSEVKLSDLGSGRAIPIKQGYLYKRSSNSLNKEWKKKYVTLCDDGRLTYHSSLHDYMDDIHGKEIALNCVTVKLPGQRPRGSKSILTNSTLTSSMNYYWKATNNAISDGIAGLTLPKDRKNSEKQSLGSAEALRESIGKTNSHTSGDEGVVLSNSNSQTFLANDSVNSKTNDSQPSTSSNANVKKRHRRMKSGGVKNEVDDAESYEFFIVSLEGKQWHFEAPTCEERDEWVQVIEQEIFKTLQANISTKAKPTSNDLASIQMNSVPTVIHQHRNGLGILICIECSGIHRNLGSHISKVRSLGLDELQTSHLSVMLAIGNSLSNSVYEANVGGLVKPNAQSSREEKESWIRRKYEGKEFVPDINRSVTCGKLLIEAVVRSDTRGIVTTLLHSNVADVNSTVSERDLRTALHLAAAMGNLPVVQILIWNHANLQQVDHEGRTCLSYAKAACSLATTHLTHETPKTSEASLKLSPIDATKELVDMLVNLGCSDPLPITSTGTLPRRRDTLRPNVFEKLPSSVI